MATDPHYFIAIPLPVQLKGHFSTWQAELKDVLPYKQWPHQQDLHITLKFLGGVATEKLELLRSELREIGQYEPFDLKVGNIGTFGNPKKPRVLWGGVEKTETLSRFQKTVEQCAHQVGLPKENRDYRPHITLAKKWAGSSAIDEDTLHTVQAKYSDQLTLHVDKAVIYQIFPSKKPKYEIVESYALIGKRR